MVHQVADYYGLLAGALPDFWLALVLTFIFYTILRIAPAPLGRIDFAVLGFVLYLVILSLVEVLGLVGESGPARPCSHAASCT